VVVKLLARKLAGGGTTALITPLDAVMVVLSTFAKPNIDDDAYGASTLTFVVLVWKGKFW
jgi:hypothetical protein